MTRNQTMANGAGNKYNSTVVNNGWFCGRAGSGAGAQGVTQVNTALACDPAAKYEFVSGNLKWYPVPAFLLGVEVLYARVDTAFEGQQLILAPTQGRRPTGVYTARDQNVVSINFRAQRGFGGVGE